MSDRRAGIESEIRSPRWALCREAVLSLTGRGPRSRRGPHSGLAVQTEVDQSPQVERAEPSGESELVALDASVTNSSVATGDEPGDGALHHRSVLAVVVHDERIAPGLTGVDQLVVVLGDPEVLPLRRRRAALSQRAATAVKVEAGVALGADGHGVAGGTGGGAVVVVDDEVVSVETARHAAAQRDGLDHQVMASSTQLRPGLA